MDAPDNSEKMYWLHQEVQPGYKAAHLSTLGIPNRTLNMIERKVPHVGMIVPYTQDGAYCISYLTNHAFQTQILTFFRYLSDVIYSRLCQRDEKTSVNFLDFRNLFCNHGTGDTLSVLTMLMNSSNWYGSTVFIPCEEEAEIITEQLNMSHPLRILRKIVDSVFVPAVAPEGLSQIKTKKDVAEGARQYVHTVSTQLNTHLSCNIHKSLLRNFQQQICLLYVGMGLASIFMDLLENSSTEHVSEYLLDQLSRLGSTELDTFAAASPQKIEGAYLHMLIMLTSQAGVVGPRLRTIFGTDPASLIIRSALHVTQYPRGVTPPNMHRINTEMSDLLGKNWVHKFSMPGEYMYSETEDRLPLDEIIRNACVHDESLRTELHALDTFQAEEESRLSVKSEWAASTLFGLPIEDVVQIIYGVLDNEIVSKVLMEETAKMIRQQPLNPYYVAPKHVWEEVN